MSSAGCGPAPYTDTDTGTQHLSSITETEMIYYFEQCTEPTDDFTSKVRLQLNFGPGTQECTYTFIKQFCCFRPNIKGQPFNLQGVV